MPIGIDLVNSAVLAVKDRYPDYAYIALFGSRAREDQNSNSDLDLLVATNGKRASDMQQISNLTYGVDVDIFSFGCDNISHEIQRAINKLNPQFLDIIYGSKFAAGNVDLLNDHKSICRSYRSHPSIVKYARLMLVSRIPSYKTAVHRIECAKDFYECQMIAFNLVFQLSNAILLIATGWLDSPKWLHRKLASLKIGPYIQLRQAADLLFKNDNPSPLISAATKLIAEIERWISEESKFLNLTIDLNG